MSPTLRLSILVPVFNERLHVEDLLASVRAVRFQEGVEVEVVVVDDGSTDGSDRILERIAETEPRIRLLRHEKNRGKEAAVRSAVEAARGDVMVIQDADLEYNPAELPQLLDPILAGHADAVFGSRFLPRGHKRVLYFWHCLGNKLITLFSNMLTNLDLTDIETCYKMVKGPILRSIPIRSQRFGIEPELVAKLAKRGCRIFEVPISYKGRTYREGKKITWRDGLQAVYVILKYWLIDDIYDGPCGREMLFNLSRTHRLNRWMADLVRPHLGDRVLEIGAGLGAIALHLLPRESYVVSDVDDLHLDYLSALFASRKRVEVRRVDIDRAEDFRGLQGCFDTVVCLNVLERVADDQAGAAQYPLRACTRRKAVPAGARLAAAVRQLGCGPRHRRRYRPDELARRPQRPASRSKSRLLSTRSPCSVGT